jgi:creatinine amidohydrolase
VQKGEAKGMSERRTVELGRMSWSEVAEARDENPIVLLPIGTVEQHGPHIPVNADNMVASFVALEAAQRTNALVAPNINYGVSALFRNFPGTLTVRPETLAAMIRDVCAALIGQGFRRIIFVNNHGGNESVCEQVAREIKAEHGIIVGDIYPWSLGYALMRDAFEDPAAVYGHGGEPETSAMLAMFPEDVTRARMEAAKPQSAGGFEPTGGGQVRIPGQAIGGKVFLDSDELFPNGVTGDPSGASEATGQLWIERVVGFAVDFIKHFDAQTADAAWARPVRGS